MHVIGHSSHVSDVSGVFSLQRDSQVKQLLLKKIPQLVAPV